MYFILSFPRVRALYGAQENSDLEALDPNSVCTNLTAELKRLGFAADFAPAKLRTGWGECVCRVLEFVADRALARRGFAMAPPVRAAERGAALDGAYLMFG